MTERAHLDYRDTREDAWDVAENYAKLVTEHKLPLAIGVRELAKPSKNIGGGFEIYAVLTPIPDTEETKTS